MSMYKCPKCSTEYGNDQKICRICGAILEAVAG
jgi:rRNA maturation endonuclease Nob1